MSGFGDYFDDQISDFWRLPSELKVRQAALLIVGCDPSSSAGSNCENWKVSERPSGYEAAKQGVSAALRSGKIKGEHFSLIDYDMNGNPCGEIEGSTDIERSSVDRESLIDWLLSRGIRSGFFFPTATEAPDYLDPKNPRYAPKLAAAVRAWQSVVDPGGKHPKQALAKWLREHAAEYGMTDDEGKPNETGIEEAAKVANWQPGGGAPRTPSDQSTHPLAPS